MPQKPDSYYRPESLDEALTLLAKPNNVPLGGGTKLLASEAGLPGTAVIDLQALGLNQAKLLTANDTNILSVGATLTLASLHQFLQDELPDNAAATLLQKAIHQAGPNTYRNAATLGGTLASDLPDSELLATLLVLDTSVTLHSTTSQHTLSLADYLGDAKRPSGLITTLSIPLPAGHGASHRVARTPADFPIVSITGWQLPDGSIRLAGTGLGERPFRLTTAEQAASADVAAATSAAAAANTHPGDFRGNATYRAEMATVLTRRTLNQLHN